MVSTLKKKTNIVPMSSSFFLTSILGILLTVFFFEPSCPRWGFTANSCDSFAFAFLLVFVMMFVSAMITLTYAPSPEHINR